MIASSLPAAVHSSEAGHAGADDNQTARLGSEQMLERASYGQDPGRPKSLRGLPRRLRYVTCATMWTMDGDVHPPQTDGAADDRLRRGIAGSHGRYTGRVVVVREETQFDDLRRGDVLVCPTTTPAWSVLFNRAGALVTDGGGLLSHAAVIAREYGIPAVLATSSATRRLRGGDVVTVDGTHGTVEVGRS